MRKMRKIDFLKRCIAMLLVVSLMGSQLIMPSNISFAADTSGELIVQEEETTTDSGSADTTGSEATSGSEDTSGSTDSADSTDAVGSTDAAGTILSIENIEEVTNTSSSDSDASESSTSGTETENSSAYESESETETEASVLSVAASLSAAAVSNTENEYQVRAVFTVSGSGEETVRLALCMDEISYAILLDSCAAEPETAATDTCVITLTDGTFLTTEKTELDDGSVLLSFDYAADGTNALNTNGTAAAVGEETSAAGNASGSSSDTGTMTLEFVLTADAGTVEKDTLGTLTAMWSSDSDADAADAVWITLDTIHIAWTAVEEETETESETETETETEPETETETASVTITKTEDEAEEESETETEAGESEPVSDETEAATEYDTEEPELETETEDEYAATVTADVTGTAARSSLLRAGIATVAEEDASVDLSDYITGAEFNKDTIENGEILKVTIDYQLYAQVLKSAGTNTLTYQLPEGIVPIRDYEGTVTDSSGNSVGTYTIKTKWVTNSDGETVKVGVITIDLEDDFVDSGNTITGSISFWSTLTVSSDEEDQELTFSFSDSNQVTTTIQVNKETEGETDQSETEKKTDIYVDKSYVVNSTDSGDGTETVTYTLEIGSLNGTGDSAISVLTDYLQNWDWNGICIESIEGKTITKTSADGSTTSYTFSDYLTITTDNTENYTKGTISLSSEKELDALEAGEYYTITYTVTYRGLDQVNGEISLNNSATAKTEDEKNSASDSATVTIKHNYLTKTSYYKSSTDEITWEITLNEFGGDLDGYTLSDTLTLDGEVVDLPDAVTMTEYKSDGSTVTYSVALPFTFSTGGTANLADETGTGTYDTTSKFVVTYTTDASDVGFSGYYSNTATLSDDTGDHSFTDEEDKRVTHSDGVLDKSYVANDDESVDGNANLRNYEWEVTIVVPSDGMEGATYTDSITATVNNVSSSGAHYITAAQLSALEVNGIDSAKSSQSLTNGTDYKVYVKYNSGWVEFNSSEASESDTYTEFKIEFLSALTDYTCIELSYNTTGDFTNYEDSTITFTNTGTFAHNGGTTSSSDSAKGTQGGYLVKLHAGGSNTNTVSYDSIKGVLYYCLMINTNEQFTEDGDIVITDILPEGTTLYTGEFSISVISGKGTVNGSEYVDTDSHVKAYYGLDSGSSDLYQTVNRYQPSYDPCYDPNDDITVKYDDATRTLTITISQDAYYGYLDSSSAPVSKSLSIYYAAQITDALGKNETKSYTNNATMQFDGSEYTDSVTDIVTTSYISKTLDSTVETGDREKAYSVLVNPTGASLNGGEDITVTDTVVYGRFLTAVALKPGSFHLYRLNADGSKGSEISIALYSVQYTDDGTQFVMSITLADETAYVMEYVYTFTVDEDTFIESNGGKSGDFDVTNTIEISGSHIEDTSSKVTDEEVVGDSSATADTDRITVVKVDADNQILYLSGAFFTLEKFDADVFATAYAVDNSVDYKSDTYWTEVKTYVTGSDGTVVLGGLEKNYIYRLHETEAPTNYEEATEDYYFYYTADTATLSTWSDLGISDLNQVKNGSTITFKDTKTTGEKTSIAVTKAWYDAKGNTLTGSKITDTDGNVIDSITLNLYQTTESDKTDFSGDTPYKTVTFAPDDDGTWYYVFNNLDKDDGAGNTYYYFVEETGSYTWYDTDTTTGSTGSSTNLSDSYTLSSDMDTVITSGTVSLTNTKLPSKISVSVEKKWEDENETEAEVEVTLYRSKTAPAVPETTEINAYVYYCYESNSTTYTSGDSSNGSRVLTVAKSTGSRVVFTIASEGASVDNVATYQIGSGDSKTVLSTKTADGYEFEISGVSEDVTLYVTVGYNYGLSSTVEVQDELSGMAELPGDAEVYDDASTTDITEGIATLNSAGDWSYEWENLDDDYYYYVVEGTNGVISGYSTTYYYTYQTGEDGSASEENGIRTVTITNSKNEESEITEIAVIKKWSDAVSDASTRPDVTAKLYRSYLSPEGAVITVSVADWTNGSAPTETDAYITITLYKRVYANQWSYSDTEWQTVTLNAENNWSVTLTDADYVDGMAYLWYTYGCSYDYSVVTAVSSYGTSSDTSTSNTVLSNAGGSIYLQATAATTASGSNAQTETSNTEGNQETEESTLLMASDAEYMGDSYDLVLNYENSWTASWDDLPKTDGLGNLYYYYVEEVSVDGYTTTYAYTYNTAGDILSGINGVEITNTAEDMPDTTSVTVNKTWIENGTTLSATEANQKAWTATVQLLVSETDCADGTIPSDAVIYSTDEDYTVVLSAENSWTYTWKNLPLTSDTSGGNAGTNYYYYVKEIGTVVGTVTTDETSVSPSYAITDGSDGSRQITVTNEVTTTSVSVSKKWYDASGAEETMADDITVSVRLYQEQSEDVWSYYESEPVVLGSSYANVAADTGYYSADGWTYTWTDLPEGTYYVEEVSSAASGYETSYQNSSTAATDPGSEDAADAAVELSAEKSSDTITINNQKPSTEITVEKYWDDNNSTDRPGEVVMNLYRSTEVPSETEPTYGTLTVDVSDWYYSDGVSADETLASGSGVWIGVWLLNEDDSWTQVAENSIGADENWTWETSLPMVVSGEDRTYLVNYAAWGSIASLTQKDSSLQVNTETGAVYVTGSADGVTLDLVATYSASSTDDGTEYGTVTVNITDWLYSDGVAADATVAGDDGYVWVGLANITGNQWTYVDGGDMRIGVDWSYTFDNVETKINGVVQTYSVFWSAGDGTDDNTIYQATVLKDGSTTTAIDNTGATATVTGSTTDNVVNFSATLYAKSTYSVTAKVSEWYYNDGNTADESAADDVDAWVWVGLFNSYGALAASTILSEDNWSWTTEVPTMLNGIEQTYTIRYSYGDAVQSVSVLDSSTVTAGGSGTVSAASDAELDLSVTLDQEKPIQNSDIDITVEINRWLDHNGKSTTSSSADESSWAIVTIEECDSTGETVSGGTSQTVTLNYSNGWMDTITLPGVVNDEVKYYKVSDTVTLTDAGNSVANTITAMALNSGTSMVSGENSAFGFLYTATLAESQAEETEAGITFSIAKWRLGDNIYYGYSDTDTALSDTASSVTISFWDGSYSATYQVTLSAENNWSATVTEEDGYDLSGNTSYYIWGDSFSCSGSLKVISIYSGMSSGDGYGAIDISNGTANVKLYGYYTETALTSVSLTSTSASTEIVSASLTENVSLHTMSSQSEPETTAGEAKDTWDGELIDSYTLTADASASGTDPWSSYTWSGLDQYDSHGNRYYYYIVESYVAGYTQSYEYEYQTETDVQGNSSATSDIGTVKVTNTRADAIDVTVNKKWNGYGDGEYDAYSVTVQLYKNGTANGNSVTLNMENNWSYKWEDLDGAYTYTVEEISVTDSSVTSGNSAISNYQASYDYTNYDDLNGGTITITNDKTTSITVTKDWLDVFGNATSTDIPESIQVQLYQIAEGDTSAYGDPVTLSADTGSAWSYTWTGLLVGSAADPYEYYVEEINIPDGYTTTYQADEQQSGSSSSESAATESGSIEITNQKIPTEISVSKTWNDGDSSDRPDSVTVQLYRSTTVPEVKGSITVSVADWLDTSGAVASAPSSGYIWASVCDSGWNVIASSSLDVNNGWSVTFDDDLLNAGETYIIQFGCGSDDDSNVVVSADLTGNITDENYATYITYKSYEYTPTEAGIAISLTAVTSDTSNSLSLASGANSEGDTSGRKAVAGATAYGGSVDLSGSNSAAEGYTDGGWTYTWSNLDKYDASGNLYYYYVLETSVPSGYTAYYSYTYADDGTIQSISIKNSTVTTTSILVEKKWEGFTEDEGVYGYEDYVVEVTLCKDGVETSETEILSNSNNWKASWSDLDAGAEYSVKETAVYNGSGTDRADITNTFDAAISTTTTEDGKTITITNKKKTTEIEVEKKWGDDEGNHTSDTVTMQLYRSTTAPSTGSITVDVSGWLDSTGAATTALNSYNSGIWLNLYEEDEDYTWVYVTDGGISLGSNWSYTFSGLTIGKTYIVQFGTWGSEITSLNDSDEPQSQYVYNLARDAEVSLTAQLISDAPVTGTSTGTASGYSNSIDTSGIVTGSGICMAEDAVAVGNSIVLGEAAAGGIGYWSYEWTGLDMYNSSGNLYYYYVVETSSKDGYVASYEYTVDELTNTIQKVTVTNSKKTIKVKVQKQWDSESYTDPSEYQNFLITVQLYQNDEVMDGDSYTQILSSDNSWYYCWSGLKSGYSYSVKEVSVQAWTDTNDNGSYDAGTDTLEDVSTCSATYSYGTEKSSDYSEVTISSTGTITITNTKTSGQGITLPGTGSKYPLIFYGLGLSFLVVSSTWMLYAFKKKKYKYAGKGGAKPDSS